MFSLTNCRFSYSESWKISSFHGRACGPDADQTQCGRIDIGPAECVKEEAAPVTGGEEQCVQYARFHMCVCVCDRRRSPWLHLKWILQRGDPPFQAFRFLTPHPPTLQPSTQASLALSPRNGAADPGQSSLIVPPCYNVTALPSKGSRQSTALHVSMVCQCPKTGRGQGNDGRLRHDGCTFINPWPFLLFSFAH